MKLQVQLNLFVLLLFGSCSAYSGEETKADRFRFLHLSDNELKDAIVRHIPVELDTALLEVDDEALPLYFRVYVGTDTSYGIKAGLAVVYLTDASNLSMLQLYSSREGGWELTSEVRGMTIGYAAHFEFRDIDCDSVPEVLVVKGTGNGGFMIVDVIKVMENQLFALTPDLIGKNIWGRTVEFRHHAEPCEIELEMTFENPANRITDSVEVYRFTAATKAFRLVKAQKLQSDK